MPRLLGAPAHLNSGTRAAQPAAATYGTGFYYVTDENVLERSDGSAWTQIMLSGGDELAASEKTDTHKTLTTTRTDISNLATISFTVAAGQIVYVDLTVPYLSHQAAAGGFSLFISDNAGADAAANIKEEARSGLAYTAGASITIGGVVVRERITAAGSYVRKGQVQARGSNSDASNGIQSSATAKTKLVAYTKR